MDFGLAIHNLLAFEVSDGYCIRHISIARHPPEKQIHAFLLQFLCHASGILIALVPRVLKNRAAEIEIALNTVRPCDPITNWRPR